MSVDLVLMVVPFTKVRGKGKEPFGHEWVARPVWDILNQSEIGLCCICPSVIDHFRGKDLI